MTTPRTINGGNGNPVDDEFLQQLYRAGELLAEGKVVEAREYLERAGKLQPEDEKCQNLLGLTYFKLGLFDKAASVYDALVKANPADPTLRVNLGLVYLKTNFLVRAIREFQTAINLAPDHKKAHNYLGLALAQAGEYGPAREHFIAAGSEAMADKMARAATTPGEAEAPPPLPGHDPAVAAIENLGAAEPLANAPYAQVTMYPSPPPVGPAAGATAEWVGQFGADWSSGMSMAGPPVLEAHPALAQSAFSGGGLVPGVGLSPAAAVPSLRELAVSLELTREPPVGGPFQVQDGTLAIAVSGQMLTRLSGMVAFSGALTFTPERKRFRDRATDRWFGEGEAQMSRVGGQGTIYFDARNRVFTPMHLGEEPAYFREDALFAFESTMTFENGRLPSPFAADLDLVHVRGRGALLLCVNGVLRSVDVALSRPATVPLQGLIGWQGHLTPRIASVVSDDDGKVQRAGLELSGEGFALFIVPLS